MKTWRLIESPPADIFSQMALDRELFEQFVRSPGLPSLLRIFRVNEPAVTVGRSRRFLSRVPPGSWRDEPPCVRPTGGGLVRHGDDLIYSVFARPGTFPTFGRVRTSYLSFHEAVQEAFSTLGLSTRLFRCDEAAQRGRGKRKRGPRLEECFKEPVATDVLLEENKVAGGGQWRRREGFLHQGSIQIPKGRSYENLRDALIRAFERKFEIAWSGQGTAPLRIAATSPCASRKGWYCSRDPGQTRASRWGLLDRAADGGLSKLARGLFRCEVLSSRVRP